MRDTQAMMPRIKYGIVIGAFIIYAMAFITFSRFWGVGPGIGYLVLIPLISLSLMYGFKVGLIAGMLSHPVNVVFQYVLGSQLIWDYFGPRPIAAWFSAIFIGSFVGYMRDVNLRYRKALGELEKTNRKLQSALDEIRTLSGMLPICANCKKVRDDQGYWQQIEGYIQSHSDAEISHGICPECAGKLYPDIDMEGDK